MKSKAGSLRRSKNTVLTQRNRAVKEREQKLDYLKML